MKDIETLALESMIEMDELGIPYRNVKSFTTYTKNHFGTCTRISSEEFKIEIAEWLLNDDVPDEVIKNTILHELIHTVKDCFNHGRVFQKYARMLNNKYGYNIGTRADESDMEYYYIHNDKPTYKYYVGCTKCDTKIGYKRMCESVKNPGRYICSHCGAKIVRLV